MVKIIDTSRLTPARLTPQEREYVYNGLDCCITAEVLEVLQPQLDNITRATYEFSKDLQGPVLDMRLRGVLVDEPRRIFVLEKYDEQLDGLASQLERIVREGVGLIGFNWGSTKQLQELFYGRLGIPPIKRKGRPTVDRDALESMEQYLVARPIISSLKAMRDISKKISVLRTEIDPDGRMRTSYNIGGTNTGRLSSSFNEFGAGTNLQNIEDLLRSVFIADKGMKMGYFDAEQGESRVVGGIEYRLFNDGRYLDACETGDLHTSVAKMVWPDLHWTGDPEADKALAELPYYRHYSRRFMCKKIGHGTNYDGKPATLAQQAKVDIELIQEFQPIYFRAFPAHLRWHQWVRETIQREGVLVSLLGRKRQFWGRRTDPEVLRAAIAYDPQGSLGDIVNRGMINLWRLNLCQLLMQVHDAVVVQYPEEKEDEIVPKIQAALRYPVRIKDREMIIPYGCKTGWNFGEFNEKTNPEGLKSYKGKDKRKRSPVLGILDREFR